MESTPVTPVQGAQPLPPAPQDVLELKSPESSEATSPFSNAQQPIGSPPANYNERLWTFNKNLQGGVQRAASDIAKQSSSTLSAATKRLNITRTNSNPIEFREIDVPTHSQSKPEPPPPSKDSKRRGYWLMRLLHRNIKEGGYISESVYAPNFIWIQDGPKIAGVTTKTTIFQQLLDSIEKIEKLPLPADGSVSKHEDALKELCAEIITSQNALARPFPFIPEIHVEDKAAAQYQQQGGLGRLTGHLVGFGKMVKKQAITAVERVGAAVPARISFQELDKYVKVVSALAQKCQFIDIWLSPADSTTACAYFAPEDVARHQATALKLNQHPQMMENVLQILCVLVVKDLALLIERYIRNATRVLWAASDWDDLPAASGLQGHGESVSSPTTTASTVEMLS